MDCDCARTGTGFEPLKTVAAPLELRKPHHRHLIVAAADESQAALPGQAEPLPASPKEALLDRVPNPHRDTNYVARFTAPEFTTLCPITSQPDFAHLVIDYVRRMALESKSLKLYLGSFRNIGAFHEDCTVAVGKKLVALLSRNGCASAATGIRARHADRRVLAGRQAPAGLWVPTRASRPIVGAAKDGRAQQSQAAPSPLGPDRARASRCP